MRRLASEEKESSVGSSSVSAVIPETVKMLFSIDGDEKSFASIEIWEKGDVQVNIDFRGLSLQTIMNLMWLIIKTFSAFKITNSLTEAKNLPLH